MPLSARSREPEAGRERGRARRQGAIGRDVEAVDVDDDPADLLAQCRRGRRSGPRNRPGEPPPRRARRGRPSGRGRSRCRRRSGCCRPGCASPRRPSRRATGPPANELTPYDPRVAARTMSAMARPVTRDRPGVGRMATRAGPPCGSEVGRCSSDGRRPWRPPLQGAAGSVCYHTAPLGQTCPGAPSDTISEDTHGPLLRDLRQGFDGRLQPAVVGHEPRPSPPPHAARTSSRSSST